MSARAEQLADEAAGRALAQQAAVYKAAGVALPYSRAELADIILPVVEVLAPFSGAMGDGAGDLGGTAQEIGKTMRKQVRKNAKLLRRNVRLMKAIATPSEAPMWGRGPR